MTVVATAWRACLWALLLGCLACFVFISFARPTEWYNNSQGVADAQAAMNIPFPGNVPLATKVVMHNGMANIVTVGQNQALMDGSVTFPLVLQWGSLLLAGLCTTALLPGWRSTRPHDAAPLPDGTIKGMASMFLYQVRRIATHPLPPRRFWSWFCGGLNAIELLVFATWLGYAIVYIYFNVQNEFEGVADTFAAPPPAPLQSKAAVQGGEGTGVPASQALPAMYLVDRLQGCAVAMGEALRGLLMVMFIPVSRSSFLKWLFGADFSYLIKFHRWMSYGTLTVATLHGLLFLIKYGASGDLDLSSPTSVFVWQPTRHNLVITGIVALTAGLAMAATAHPWIRANYYRVFINVHLIGFMVFTIFAMMHYKGMVNWIVPGLLLYGLDRAFRFWQLASNWALVQPCDLTADGSVVTLKLRWTSGARVVPGQTVYLRVPRLSWQAHPFSVAGVEEVAPADADTPPACHVTLHMKVSGSWTKGLCALAWDAQPVWMQVEGPYDTCLDPVPAGPAVVMIAGGTGITPLLGLLRHYLAHPGSRPRTTYLLWSCRALCELRILGSDLLEAASPLDTAGTKSEKGSDVAGSGKPEVSVVTSPLEDTPHTSLHTSSHTSPHLEESTRPWLRACLHYTGFEAAADVSCGDLKGLSSAPSAAKLKPSASTAFSATDAASSESGSTTGHANVPSAATAAAAPHAAAAAASASGLLTPHPLASPALYAACLTLSVFGAFAGFITANYVDAYQSRITASGMFYPVTGVMQWFLIALGMVVPPIALLAALAGLRRVAPLHPCLRLLGCIPAGHAMGGALFKDSDAEAGDLTMAKGCKGPRALEMTGVTGQAGAARARGVDGNGVEAAQKLVIAPGPRLVVAAAAGGAGADGAGDAKGEGKDGGNGGRGLQLRRGRPDVAGLLRRVRAAHSGECSEVEVLVGGPPAMWDAVQEACVRVGAEEGPGPALRARRVAHQH